MANLQIRLDDGLKMEAQRVAEALGMEVATAVRMFLSQMVREKRLPFTPSLHDVQSPQVTSQISREEWLREAVHTGLQALAVKDYASDEEIRAIFTKAGANAG